MNNSDNTIGIWVAAGAVFGFLAVAFGAFGAHALKNTFTVHIAAVYETAVRFQMYHALAILGTAALSERYVAVRYGRAACWLFAAGIVLFSGSLYTYAITGMPAVAYITPAGGVAFLAGWAALAAGALKRRHSGI